MEIITQTELRLAIVMTNRVSCSSRCIGGFERAGLAADAETMMKEDAEKHTEWCVLCDMDGIGWDDRSAMKESGEGQELSLTIFSTMPKLRGISQSL